MSGVAQLAECVATILVELRELRAEVASRSQEVKAGPSRGEEVTDMTRPVSAVELCERWKITAPSRALRLTYLARKCKAWGLRPLKGTRGEGAMFARDAVIHAEAVGAGKINRRRNA